MWQWLNKWITKKQYPPFFDTYLSGQFKKKGEQLRKTRFVVLDTETTGLNIYQDRIISIGAVEIVDFELLVQSAMELYIHQSHFNTETVPIHGLMRNDLTEAMSEDEAIRQFIPFIGDAVLVGHQISFDVKMINNMLTRNGYTSLKNKTIDTIDLYKATQIRSPLVQSAATSLDDIAEKYRLDVSDRHTAAGDAFLTALIFLKTATNLERNKQWDLKKMLRLRSKSIF